jgi:hypothetical protein
LWHHLKRWIEEDKSITATGCNSASMCAANSDAEGCHHSALASQR